MIGGFRRRGCTVHQVALVEFARLRAGGPDVQRALDHVDRCRACEDDLAATTLVLHALRYLHEETGRAQPAPDGWAHLRPRLARTRRQPSLLMTCLPGAALALALVVSVGEPPSMRGTPAVLDDGSAVVLRHSSVDDALRHEPGPETGATVNVAIPLTWRVQDLPRQSAPLARSRAVDAPTTIGAEPAAVEPAGRPEKTAPLEAQVTLEVTLPNAAR